MPKPDFELPDWMGIFTAIEPCEPYVLYHYELSKRRLATFKSDAAQEAREPLQLMTYDVEKTNLTVYPQQTSPSSYGSPKYSRLVSITFEGFDLSDDPYEMLQQLPTGAVKDPDYGLGLIKECRFIVEAIEEIPDVISLTISKTRQTSIEATCFILSFNEFDELRRRLDRIHEHAVSEANIEKEVRAFNFLLSQRQPDKFPERQLPYRKDILFKTVALRESQLSRKDKAHAMKLVNANLQTISSENPTELLRLKNNIELVSIEQLIDKFRSLLSQDRAESFWQRFLTEHGFILNLALPLPVSIIGETLVVGGRSVVGVGDKITDFLIKNSLSDNITLVEIKKPGTPLIGHVYRDSVYPPSKELAGAVVQVLDQRYHLQMEIAQLLHNSRRYDLQSYAIQCIVIAGRMPEEADCKKSLELYRNSLMGITIVTFDELLLKLETLHEVLSRERIEEDDDKEEIRD